MVRPGEFEEGIRQLITKTDENYKKILRLIYEENQKLDLFRSYGVDRIFELRFLSLDPKFRGQGIGFHLLNMSQENGIKNGFTVHRIRILFIIFTFNKKYFFLIPTFTDSQSGIHKFFLETKVAKNAV